MRCYYVLVHGQLTWLRELPADELGKPDGFYCDRYVLAGDEASATAKALQRVRENLDRRTGWLTNSIARLALETDEVSVAPIHKLLSRENRGHTFYEES